MIKRQARGFTMVEMVCTIVIAGVLSAVAMPRLIDVSSASKGARDAGVQGALSSANALNVAYWNASAGTKGVRTVFKQCSVVLPSFLVGGTMPAGYTVYSSQMIMGQPGKEYVCTYRTPSGENVDTIVTVTQ